MHDAGRGNFHEMSKFTMVLYNDSFEHSDGEDSMTT